MTGTDLYRPLEHMPPSQAGAVPALAVGAKQPLHAGNQIRLWRCEQQVEMVSHEHLCVNPPAVTGANLSQPEYERFPVVIGLKHRLAAVAAGHHVVDCPGILETDRSRSCRQRPKNALASQPNVSARGLTPFTGSSGRSRARAVVTC